MRRALLLFFLIFPMLLFAQDYSYARKSIVFSDTLKKASTVKSIGKALEQPAAVVSLKISDSSSFVKFTENVSRFVNLRKISIENFYDKKLQLPAAFWNLQKLEYVSLDNLQIEGFQNLDRLKNLKYLSLMGSRLTSIPEEIYSLGSLEYLDFTLNFLDSIPPRIKELKKLRELDLTNNCFTRIPVAVTQLSQLEYLDFDNPETAETFSDGTAFCFNRLLAVPDLSNMSALKKINLYKLIIPDEKVKAQIRAANDERFKSLPR